MSQLPYLNLGAGRLILPREQPWHHGLVDAAIYQYPLWHNVDRNAEPGIDECVDLFTYPWPWADNSFDGALCTHILEHVPHEVRTSQPFPEHHPDVFMKDYLREHAEYNRAIDELRYRYQDGWYAFMAELYRVLTDGALVHILSPYGWSQGAITDPTHARYLTEQTFTHSMKPDPGSPFKYETGGIHFEMDQPAVYHVTEMFQHLKDNPVEFTRALQTRLNVVYEFYVKLRAVK